MPETTARPTTSRDPAIDALRGMAIVGMIANHVGFADHVATLVNLPGFIDPAGPFVLLAGVVLGLGTAAAPRRACSRGRDRCGRSTSRARRW